MKRVFLLVALVLGIFLSGAAAIAAATTGTPEIGNANGAIYPLKGLGFTKTQCIGEDGVAYTTLRGRWSGTETESTPGLTDYNLTGTVAVTGIVWTTNTQTGRGVLTGNIKLTDPAASKLVYSGKLTLITQGNTGGNFTGRGWIVATFQPADDAVLPPGDDMLLANIEFLIYPNNGYDANTQFGDSSPVIPDFSVVTNVAPKALDGTC